MKRHDANAAGRTKYQQMWDVIAGIGQGLGPGDEFDREIASLLAQIPRIHSAADAMHAISRIFAPSFEAHSFTEETCSEVGKQLHAALAEQGLLTQLAKREDRRPSTETGQVHAPGQIVDVLQLRAQSFKN